MTHINLICLRVFLLFIPLLAQTHIQPREIKYEGIPGFDSTLSKAYEWSLVDEGLQSKTPTGSGFRIRWLGTFGFEIGDNETSLLIDPFISRQKPMDLLQPLKIDTASVQHYLLNPMDKANLAAILVTHSHYDHLEDVPFILAQFNDNRSRPVLVGEPNSKKLIMAYDKHVEIDWIEQIGNFGNPRFKTLDLTLKQPVSFVGQFGKFRVTAFHNYHPKYNYIPWRGPQGNITGAPPFYIWQYTLYQGQSIGYLIEYESLRIYFPDSPFITALERIGPVDVLIQSIAVREVENNIADCLAIMKLLEGLYI